MPSQIKKPTATASRSGIGTVAWSNHSNITVDDASYASVSVNNETSQDLMAKTFGFLIGGHATITGVKVTIEGYKTGIGNKTVHLYLDNGTTRQTSARDVVISSTSSSSPTLVSTGGDGIMWGLTSNQLLTLLMSDDFAVAVAFGDPNMVSMYIDYVEVTVYYTNASFACDGEVDGFTDYTPTGNLSMVFSGAPIQGLTNLSSSSMGRMHKATGRVIHGLTTLYDVVINYGLGDWLSSRGQKKVEIPNIAIIKSSTLPIWSYLTVYKSAGILHASLNGGRRVSMGYEDALITDSMGNWVVLRYTGVEMLAPSMFRVELTTDVIEEIPPYTEEYAIVEAPMSGFQWEELARERYGNAEYGVILRQMYAKELEEGEKIILPRKEDLLKEVINPETHIFQRIPNKEHHFDKMEEE